MEGLSFSYVQVKYLETLVAQFLSLFVGEGDLKQNTQTNKIHKQTNKQNIHVHL